VDATISAFRLTISAGGAKVCSVGTDERAASRKRWLIELSRALGDAQQLLFELELSAAQSARAGELFQQIAAAQMEVRSLQLSRSAGMREQNDPQWIEPGPWQRRNGDFG
jgi:hypothetical protein